jgi:hypothetical protein
MKPKLWHGANPVGEARLRGLQQVDAPYLTARAPGFSAHKRGMFSEVYGGGTEETSEDDPYILSNVRVLEQEGGGAFRYALVSQESRVKERLYGTTPAMFNLQLDTAKHLGGGTVAQVLSTDGNIADGEGGWVFPVLYDVSRGTTRFFEFPPRTKKRGNLAFHVAGFQSNEYYINYMLDEWWLAAGGWAPDVRAYTGAFSYSLRGPFYKSPVNASSRSVVATESSMRIDAFDVRTLAIHRAEFASPPGTGRVFPTRVFSAGPGKYVMLWHQSDHHPAGQENDKVLVRARGQLGVFSSYDYGRTWGFQRWVALEEMTWEAKQASFPGAGDPATPLDQTVFRWLDTHPLSRDAWPDHLLQYRAGRCSFTYVGADTTFAAMPCCSEGAGVYDWEWGRSAFSAYEPNPPPPVTHWFLFKRVGTGPWVRVPWPLDTVPDRMHLARVAASLPCAYADPVYNVVDSDGFCFGPGCFGVLARPDATGVAKYLVTVDFGATWKWSPASPIQWRHTPCVIRPYDPGVGKADILITGAARFSDRQEAWGFKVEGLFDGFKGPKVLQRERRPQGVGGYHGTPDASSPVYVGQYQTQSPAYPPFVNPALPGEFDE